MPETRETPGPETAPGVSPSQAGERPIARTERRLFPTGRVGWMAPAVLVLKILLGTFFGSHFLYALFIPFLNLATTSANPWEAALTLGIPDAFPYGPVMFYILAVPRYLLSWLLPSDATAYSALHFLATRIPLLTADAAILIFLARLEPGFGRRMMTWWASPIVLYVTYVHGQLDVIPTAFLLGSLVLMLLHGRLWTSAIVLGLGIATKSHLWLAMPFIAVYVARKHASWTRGAAYFLLATLTYAAALFPWILSDGFRQMVFGTAEQKRIFEVFIHFMPNLKVYIAPLAVGLLFLHFASYKKVSRDLLLMFLGLAYTVLVTLMPPAHGYYLWPLPFVVYFFSQQTVYPRLAMWVFNGACLAYLTLGIDSTLVESFRLLIPASIHWHTPAALLQARGMDPVLVNSTLYTLVEASLLTIAIMMYRHGVQTNVLYRPRTRPTLIGIGGDSGSGKHTARTLLSDLLGTSNILTVDSDDVHKWERGHEMWRVVSHLDPNANDLYLLAEHAEALGQGRSITKVRYDHKTGKFSSPSPVYSNKYVCVVGLHPFSLKRMRGLIDLKIYMDTPEDLRVEWKTRRDMRDRGYTREQVLEQLRSRAADAARFIHPQKQFADLTVQYYPLDSVSESSEPSRLGIRIRADNSLPFGRLEEHLRLHGLKTSLQHEDDLLHQTLDVSGEIPSEAIRAIAEVFCPQLDELVDSRARWSSGHEGIFQLCFVVALSEHLRDRRGQLN